MLFPESSTIPWLVPNSEENLGRMLTESPKEFAEFPGFQTPLVLEELRFSFEGISSSWNTGFSASISLEGPPFEAVSTLSVLQKHPRGCLYQEGYIAVCCLWDTAALAFSQAPPVSYFLWWKPLFGWRGQDSAALAICQAPPVICWCVSICPLQWHVKAGLDLRGRVSNDGVYSKKMISKCLFILTYSTRKRTQIAQLLKGGMNHALRCSIPSPGIPFCLLSLLEF